MQSQPTYRSTNVREFPHTPEIEETYQRTTSSGGSSSSTTTEQLCQIKEKALAIEAMKRVFAEEIREQYAHCVGEKMPPALFRRILLDLIDGTPPQYYRYALDETCLAPRPSPRYMLAIVQRLKRERKDPADLCELF